MLCVKRGQRTLQPGPAARMFRPQVASSPRHHRQSFRLVWNGSTSNSSLWPECRSNIQTGESNMKKDKSHNSQHEAVGQADLRSIPGSSTCPLRHNNGHCKGNRRTCGSHCSTPCAAKMIGLSFLLSCSVWLHACVMVLALPRLVCRRGARPGCVAVPLQPRPKAMQSANATCDKLV